MTRSILLVLLTLTIAGATNPASVVVIETSGTPAGTYYYAVDVTADGAATALRIASVVRIGDAPPKPGPVDPDVPVNPGPDDNDMGGLLKQIDAALKSVDRTHKMAQLVKELYATAADNMPDKIKTADVARTSLIAIRNRSARIVPGGDGTQWKTLFAELDRLCEYMTIEQLKRAYTRIAEGLTDD